MCVDWDLSKMSEWALCTSLTQTEMKTDPACMCERLEKPVRCHFGQIPAYSFLHVMYFNISV